MQAELKRDAVVDVKDELNNRMFVSLASFCAAEDLKSGRRELDEGCCIRYLLAYEFYTASGWHHIDSTSHISIVIVDRTSRPCIYQ
jgi:hypothetical protein